MIPGTNSLPCLSDYSLRDVNYAVPPSSRRGHVLTTKPRAWCAERIGFLQRRLRTGLSLPPTITPLAFLVNHTHRLALERHQTHMYHEKRTPRHEARGPRGPAWANTCCDGRAASASDAFRSLLRQCDKSLSIMDTSYPVIGHPDLPSKEGGTPRLRHERIEPCLPRESFHRQPFSGNRDRKRTGFTGPCGMRQRVQPKLPRNPLPS